MVDGCTVVVSFVGCGNCPPTSLSDLLELNDMLSDDVCVFMLMQDREIFRDI